MMQTASKNRGRVARAVSNIVDARATSDGDGVKIKRIAQANNMAAYDPFLLLDEIKSDDAADYVGGFPAHPHRGFETVTYMLEGAFRHEDHLGNTGHLKAGGVQWMTAGRGVIHSEMPEIDNGRMHGFQLWVNLPAKEKMQTASYQEFAPHDITEHVFEGGLLRIIAGEFFDEKAQRLLRGPVKASATNASYFDIRLAAGASLSVPTNSEHKVLLYVYKGVVNIGARHVVSGQLAELDAGDYVSLKAADEAGLLLLSGEPINEPIAHYGPFVMNTRDEIEQALQDYRQGRLTEA